MNHSLDRPDRPNHRDDHSYLDLLLLNLNTVLAMLLVIVPGVGSVALRLLPALLLVLVAPGYTLIRALLPPRTLGLVERGVMGVGLSLIVMILGGLLLNLMPWGLNARTWVVWLGGVTMAASAAILVRQRLQPSVVPRPAQVTNWRLNATQALVCLLALQLFGASFIVARVGAQQQQSTLTQLWILPASHEGMPAVHLGVLNAEDQEMHYRLRLFINNQVQQQQDFWLPAGEQHTLLVRLPAGWLIPGRTARVEVRLYRLDQPDEIYRRVVFWLSPGAAGAEQAP